MIIESILHEKDKKRFFYFVCKLYRGIITGKRWKGGFNSVHTFHPGLINRTGEPEWIKCLWGPNFLK